MLQLVKVKEISLAFGRGVFFRFALLAFLLFVLPFAKHLYLN